MLKLVEKVTCPGYCFASSARASEMDNPLIRWSNWDVVSSMVVVVLFMIRWWWLYSKESKKRSTKAWRIDKDQQQQQQVLSIEGLKTFNMVENGLVIICLPL